MDIIIRVSAIYAFVLIGLRLIGKREFAQLTPLELVSLLLIPEIATEALTRGDHSVTQAFIGIATVFLLVLLTSTLMQWSTVAEDVIGGRPTVLVHHGHLVEDNLNQERVTPGEIFTAMHLAGLDRLERVKWAILEPDGKISVVPASGPAQAGGSPERESGTPV